MAIPDFTTLHIKVSFENTTEVSLESLSRVDVGTMLVKL